METGEAGAEDDFDVFRSGTFGSPGDFDEKVGGNLGVGGAEDGKRTVEPFGVNQIIGEGRADTKNGGRTGGEDAAWCADGAVFGEGLEIEVSEGFDVDVGVPGEAGAATGLFIKGVVVPDGMGELKVEKRGLVRAGIWEDGFVGEGGAHGATGESCGNKQGLARLVVDVVIVVVILKRIRYVGPGGVGLWGIAQ